MSSTVEQIKDRLSVQDVVSSYIKLEKAGKNFKAACPFHNEKTPSFFVSPERNSYYCFGCGAKGDIFTFVQEFEGLDFMGALKVLADRAGVRIERSDPKKRTERERMFECMEEAVSFFERGLANNTEVSAYLKKRGLAEQTIADFRIGYAKDDWRLLYDHLKGEGFTEAEMLKAGLIKVRDESGKEKRYYDTFRGRIMFPIFDSSGRPTAFSGRAATDEVEPKYLNTPETPLFVKSETLYGYDKAKGAMRKNDFCILVEGQMDLVLSHQAGFKNTVAASGTALTERHLKKIMRLTNNIVLAFDADAAGLSSVGKGATAALALGMDVKVAKMPGGADPADLVAKNPELWKEAVRKSSHIIEFYLEALAETAKDERAFKKAVHKTVLPYVAHIESSIDRAHFISTIADRLSVPESAIREELEKVRLPERGEGEEMEEREERSHTPQEIIRRRLLGIVLWQESLKDAVVDPASVRQRVSQLTGKEFPSGAVSSTLRDELIFEADVMFENAEALSDSVEDLFLRLEEEILRERFAALMRRLKEAEKKNDATEAFGILKECQDISKKMQTIKSKMHVE